MPLQVPYYSRLAFILCRSSHTKALQATMSEGLAQGPYMAARVGFEPATYRTQGTESTSEPTHPTTLPVSASDYNDIVHKQGTCFLLLLGISKMCVPTGMPTYFHLTCLPTFILLEIVLVQVRLPHTALVIFLLLTFY